jgi:phage shock protein A
MFDNPERIKPGLTVQDLAEVAVQSERQYKEMFIAAKRERDELRDRVEKLENSLERLERLVKNLSQNVGY